MPTQALWLSNRPLALDLQPVLLHLMLQRILPTDGKRPRARQETRVDLSLA